MTSAPSLPLTRSELHVHQTASSAFIEGGRTSIIYLPPGYNDSVHVRYPVLYLQDGQNLFDPQTAFAHQSWQLREVLDTLIGDGVVEPLIVVGIYNAGEGRIAEYSQIRNRQGTGGRARWYAKFVATELKPFIDSTYRTQTEGSQTGIGGSSMGGLVSFYIGLRYPHLFGKLLVMSPSIWWADRAILRETRRLHGKTDQKIWLDVGTAEGSNPNLVVQDARDLRDVLAARGWRQGYDLRYVEEEGAAHDEKAWGCRMQDALPFLFAAPDEARDPKIDAQPELHC